MDAIEVLEEFFENKEAVKHREEIYAERDKLREIKMHELVDEFLMDYMDIEELRSRTQSISRSDGLWGFGGFSGQMYFNQLVKRAEELEEIETLEKKLRSLIGLPTGLEDAVQKIDELAEYAEDLKDRSNASQGPAPKSTMFFLTYFWSHQRNEFPIAYPEVRDILKEITEFQDSAESIGELYKDFYNKLEEIKNRCEEDLNKDVRFREVSGAFYWFNKRKEEEEEEKAEEIIEEEENQGFEYSEYVPPKVSDLSEIARNNQTAKQKYENSEVSLSKIFETKTKELFDLLGFEAREMGQGHGRQPDGIAKAKRQRYAIIYDVKQSSSKYKIGTEDRKFIEYIQKYKRALETDGYQEIYFMIISSNFKKQDKGKLQKIKEETNIKEAVSIEASSLLKLLGLKVRHPEMNLGDIKGAFNRTGILKQDEIENAKPEISEI